jgi:RNA polymerase sigma-70 factor, ECF subfamily
MLDYGQCVAPPTGFGFASAPGSGMGRLMDRIADTETLDSRRAELAALIARVSSGDQPALKAVYERTSAKLYGICLRLLGDEAEAQDVLQEVFVTVWRKAAQFDQSRASGMTWLGVLARNRAIDRLRARRPAGETIDAAAEIADDGPSAIDVIEQAEDNARLSDCLETLDERARGAIRAAFFDGLTYGDLAAREAVPVGTMKSWIRRGLLRLRGCLEQ